MTESGQPSTFRARVVTVSTRTAAGVFDDRSGPILVAGLGELGLLVEGPVVVADGEPVGVALREAIDERIDVVVTTGGTGCTPTDRTPEQTQPLIDRPVPGIAEAIRAFGVAQGVPTAALSRGVAGFAGQTLLINLPGSAGGARDGLNVLCGLLVHALEQNLGSDHRRVNG
ncbi:MAG: MogA/MoaB family molybdenum cofactor biosynthesis protein [Actinomycetales bacterium]|nr:MogA/MoaB family molybdenum cofactor biosynthesis protein [Actinomycetales bacterium]